jgi:hypothetical protein
MAAVEGKSESACGLTAGFLASFSESLLWL